VARSLDFYVAAATVFPILFVSLLVERGGEALRRRPEKGRGPEPGTLDQVFDILALVWVYLVLVGGEVAALHVLDVGHATRGWRVTVIVTLGAGGVWLVLRTVTRHLRSIGQVGERLAQTLPYLYAAGTLALFLVER
jgi:hypothetical protein